ncbi:hypothetical protein Trco_001288 [Trichoderma cornu-damae]|uniref:HAD-superfamily phosphatase n=1 Tax=Trichoderma cornu-damae TaxID=654480 RepID=A0A9P8QXP5_9HYPO|nr:hypothetical protein Trco_001288 [Trichoderma cornu-damae]
MNFNLYGSLNSAKLLLKPGLCLPHYTAPTFNDVPIPLDAALQREGRRANIKAVVLDKDDCFAYPDAKEQHFEKLKQTYPGRKLLVVSNTAGSTSWDTNLKQAAEVEKSTGVFVLAHATKKPGCGAEIMAYFSKYPETGVTDPSHVAIVGDRLTTDVMLANMMGAWGFWIRDGVVPLSQKSVPPRIMRSIQLTGLLKYIYLPVSISLESIAEPLCARTMGGKTWSKQEERFFWRTIVPQSPKAVRPSDRIYDWKVCAEIMQREMGASARRKYSKLMLFEHYFQNVQTGHKSPCAREFVLEHKRELAQAQQRIRTVVQRTVARADP